MSSDRREHRAGAVASLEDPPAFAPDSIRFRDRRDAGRRLAELLEDDRYEHPVVVGIPRGGVPVAAEVAHALGAPLDVAVVRKIGAPQNPEYAIGALAEGGVHVLNEQAVRALGLSDAQVGALAARTQHDLDERLRRYRENRAPVELAGRTAILVDDGLATGNTALAALGSLRKRGAARLVLAVPVAAPGSARALRDYADEVVCVETPQEMYAVGYWYEDFRPTTDEEVTALLAENARAGSQPPAAAEHAPSHQVSIPIGAGVSLSGELTLPAQARGIVVFAHGSGSSRLSPRNRAVAKDLSDAGFATLLFDLLTPGEESDRGNVFDIALLASRLVATTEWLSDRDDTARLALGYFGASTGAAAALSAAAELGDRVGAVVSRGGRPDLARDLAAVRAPTLLIVGGADLQVLELNRDAQRRLRCESELAVIPGATHLFEEPGALEQISRLAAGWFATRLARSGPAARDRP